MKNAILAIVASIGLFGCKMPCTDPGSPAMVLSHAVESQWDCKNHVAVEGDIAAWCASHGLCQRPVGPQGVVGDLVCPIAVAMLRNQLVNHVPTQWDCDSDKIGADAAAALSSLCHLLPF